MDYFSMRELQLFPSSTIDVEEQRKIDLFLRLLDRSGVAETLQKADGYLESHENVRGRPTYNYYCLLAMILYGFAFSSGTLRDLESLCRNDLRYIYIMRDSKPDFKTIANFINKIIIPNLDEIFSKITIAILNECKVNPEDVFLDGTKIEANANKYKFVWKPTTFHNRLSDKTRYLLKILGLDRGIAAAGIIPSFQIAQKLSELSKIMETASADSLKVLNKQYYQLYQYLQKSLEYEEKEQICGPDRNSYYKTDHDATAMTLKTDYYAGLGSNMHAAYNAQAMTAKGFICSFYVSQSRNDVKDLIPALENFHKHMKYYPKNLCAHSGYGSLENYRYLASHHIGNYVKYQSWEGNVSGRNPDLFRLNSDDTITCLNGIIGRETDIEGWHAHKANAVLYRIDGCAGCGFRTYCRRYQSEEYKKLDYKIFEVVKELCWYKQQTEANLLSVKGIEIRVNRSIQAEGAFGILKQDMQYNRFRRTSLEKVTAEYALTFLGSNIRKLFRYYSGKLNLKYWTAPKDLKPEVFKKPSAKRLTNRMMKKKNISSNMKAKKSYKYKKKEAV